jgi:hypothetical protein
MHKDTINQRDLEVLSKIQAALKRSAAREPAPPPKEQPPYIIIVTILVASLCIWLINGYLQRTQSAETHTKESNEYSGQMRSPETLRDLTPPGPVPAASTEQAASTPSLANKAEPVEDKKIHIARTVICKNVLKRIPVGEQRTFSVQKDPSLMVWTDVRATAIPTQIRHIYYKKESKYVEVTLDVKYPRMRTWSLIALESKEQTGSWRVDIVSKEGDLLDQAEFTVVP